MKWKRTKDWQLHTYVVWAFTMNNTSTTIKSKPCNSLKCLSFLKILFVQSLESLLAPYLLNFGHKLNRFRIIDVMSICEKQMGIWKKSGRGLHFQLPKTLLVHFIYTLLILLNSNEILWIFNTVIRLGILEKYIILQGHSQHQSESSSLLHPK